MNFNFNNEKNVRLFASDFSNSLRHLSTFVHGNIPYYHVFVLSFLAFLPHIRVALFQVLAVESLSTRFFQILAQKVHLFPILIAQHIHIHIHTP
jgi:hypothetical protein